MLSVCPPRSRTAGPRTHRPDHAAAPTQRRRVFGGRAADLKDANAANPFSANKSYQSDNDAVCNINFLAGQQYFAAAEIEVFQL